LDEGITVVIMSTHRRAWWLAAPLLAAVVGLLAGGMYSLWQLSRASEWVRHTNEVRSSLATFASTVLDAETGMHGYVVTGDSQFLQPYETAAHGWREQLATVRTLTADNAQQQARLARVETLTASRFAALARLRADYDAGQRGKELAPAMRDAKREMDSLRGLLADLQQQEVRLDAVRQEAVRRRWRLTLWLFIASALAFFVAVVIGRQRRSAAERRQRSTEERFRLMVENVEDYAIIALDREGRVTTWNRGAQEIKGWRADEIIGQHFSRFYPEEDVRAGKCERELELVAREGRFEEEGWRVRADGSRFWANVVINAIRDEKGHLVGFTKLTRDLSERRKAAEALAEEFQRRTTAEQESRFAQMFIAILGHDLRNPLNAIAMAAQLLKRKIGRADPKVIERITSSTERMSNMVDQLLDLTRNRLAGGITIEKKNVNLSEIVTTVVEELRLVHPERRIEWTPVSESHCAWDPGRMAQVISNLVGNALEHSPPTSPVAVRLESTASEVMLSVHNDGPPIPADLLPDIFDPYRRNTVRSAGSKGLGLGLYITQQLVQAHGGRIEVRSTAEAGTTFTFFVPYAPHANMAPHGGFGYDGVTNDGGDGSGGTALGHSRRRG
jgi:PAS domain S-box-containing protein